MESNQMQGSTSELVASHPPHHDALSPSSGSDKGARASHHSAACSAASSAYDNRCSGAELCLACRKFLGMCRLCADVANKALHIPLACVSVLNIKLLQLYQR